MSTAVIKNWLGGWVVGWVGGWVGGWLGGWVGGLVGGWLGGGDALSTDPRLTPSGRLVIHELERTRKFLFVLKSLVSKRKAAYLLSQ